MMSNSTLSKRHWVAFGAVGAVGSIRETDDGFTFRILDGSDYRGMFPTLDAAKGALFAALPPGSERPQFSEH
jgi:hypothetical protein